MKIHSLWTVCIGLSGLVASAFANDVYVLHAAGVARFDGTSGASLDPNFHTFPPGFGWVWSMELGPDGALWIPTNIGSQSGIWRVPLQAGSAGSFLPADAANTWGATFDGGELVLTNFSSTRIVDPTTGVTLRSFPQVTFGDVSAYGDRLIATDSNGGGLNVLDRFTGQLSPFADPVESRIEQITTRRIGSNLLACGRAAPPFGTRSAIIEYSPTGQHVRSVILPSGIGALGIAELANGAFMITGGGVWTFDPGTGIETQVSSLAGRHIVVVDGFNHGTTSCSGRPNSTGFEGSLYARGYPYAGLPLLRFSAEQLPLQSACLLLVSRASAFTPGAGGGQGDLCLGGAIGRWPQVLSSGSTGTFEVACDPAGLPTPAGPITALSGEAWYFQVWYRDAAPSGPTSNLTSAVRVDFE